MNKRIHIGWVVALFAVVLTVRGFSQIRSPEIALHGWEIFHADGATPSRILLNKDTGDSYWLGKFEVEDEPIPVSAWMRMKKMRP